MPERKGLTLVEILVVLVIIATLAALAWPNYAAIKEKSLNKEARATLLLIRAAEKIYRIEQGFYYPNLDATNVTSDINNFLKLSLPETAARSWSINIDSRAPTEFATATRTGVGADGRQWSINFPADKDVCAGNTACP